MENTNNINTINKPTGLFIEDAKQSIINTINEVNLHPTLLEMILRDIYNEAKELARAQYEREKAEYEQALAEQNSIIEKDNNIIEEECNYIDEEPTEK